MTVTRRAQITDAAAVAFGRRGYHGVGISDIARDVGISGPALYRYFPTKYALFAHTALHEMECLVEAASVAAPGDLELVLHSIAAVTVAHRDHGSMYRWEGRFLDDADRARLREHTRTLGSLVSAPLRDRRPDLLPRDAALLTAAALATIASVTTHRITLPDEALTDQVVCLAARALDARLPPLPDAPAHANPGAAPTDPPRPGLRPSSRRELLVTEALKIFEQRGYHQATLEEIGAAVCLNASSVYRYFPTKSAILSAAFQRAAHQLSAVTEAALADADDARNALAGLATAYVSLWFQRPEVMTVYFAEIAHVPDQEREALRRAQRDHVEEWVALVREIDPKLSLGLARLRVHAALNVVVDVGRLVRFDQRPEVRAGVEALMAVVLLDDRPRSSGTPCVTDMEENAR